MTRASAHPYVPNSAPAVKRSLLDAIGVSDVDELYAAIPARLRLEGDLDLPAAIPSEYALRRRLESTLARNASCRETLSFLGAGCWPHYVPAVVDEVVNRAEFLTAYYGDTYGDHGKLQALFEYASLVGELVELDAVGLPTYDWATAAASAISMAARRAERGVALVAATTGPERLDVIRGYCQPALEVRTIPFDRTTGLVDRDALAALLSDEVACVYVEVPGYLGTIETDPASIGEVAHAAGALFAVGVDPVSLGVLAPPSAYGADVVCGELQPLGVHMHYGGGAAGFVASPDDEEWIAEYPTFLIGIAPTAVPGEYGFGEVAWERISYVQRGDSKEYTGTTQNLWAIAAAVHLSLLGPSGLAELGTGLMQRVRYAATRLAELPGVTAPVLSAPSFKELVVGFDGTGRTVAEIDAALRSRGIFGGRDLSAEFPELGQSALYCFTEIHAKDDVDRLVETLAEVLR